MDDSFEVFSFLKEARESGHRCVLVTIVQVIDGSPRPVGAHMGVREDGAYVGYLSGGCIEAAVAQEALAVLDSSTARVVRYGQGSEYMDIHLPCGGGLDLLFLPEPSSTRIDHVLGRLMNRESFSVRYDLAPADVQLTPATPTVLASEYLTRLYKPNPHLVVIGAGRELVAMVQAALGAGLTVDAVSPDVLALAAPGLALHHWPASAALPDYQADPWTAAIVLFHDREREVAALQHLLRRESYYLAALGSARTHEKRLSLLMEAGCKADDLSRITGTPGLIPATRDANTLAVSILAEVLARYQQAFGA